MLSALQLTSMFPNLGPRELLLKTRNSIDAGKSQPPYGYVIPVQRDMTRVASLVNILRVAADRGRPGEAEDQDVSDGDFPAGSFVIKRDQPYGRLAKNLLEKPESIPIPTSRTYDDSGWTMGLAMLVDVKEIKDKAILDAAVTPVDQAAIKGTVGGKGTAGVAVAHLRLEQHDRAALSAARQCR